MAFTQKWNCIHHNNGNAVWCDHSIQGYGQYETKHYAIYYNPSSSATLLHLAQAMEQYEMTLKPPVIEYNYSIQSFTIRGLKYDKSIAGNIIANQVLANQEIFHVQCDAHGRVKWSKVFCAIL